MIIRHLQPGEPWPDGCEMGYPPSMIYYDWVWVAEHEGKLVAALVGIPAHGLLLMLRIAANEGAPVTATGRLMWAAIAEAESRGLQGYLVWVDPTTNPGQRMISLTRHAGGQQLTSPSVLCCASFKDIQQSREAQYES